MDIGFVNDPTAEKDSRCHWSQILVPGELKNNPTADIASKAWLDIGRYAREVLAAQDSRRFVLGFTICGSLIRIWEFDRLGGIASEQFNINEYGQRFVSIILGFLQMDEEQLEFDPTIKITNGERFIEIKRNGLIERLIIDEVIRRAHCITGRATTCWKAHCEGDPQTPLVIKDSRQYPEREEEGELLYEATKKKVVNLARYYYHETVQVRHANDDIRSNVRKGLNVRTAKNHRRECSIFNASRRGHGSSTSSNSNSIGSIDSIGGIVSRKRPSSNTGSHPPRSKRTRPASPTKADSDYQIEYIGV
jgi:Fungal protein kinase